MARFDPKDGDTLPMVRLGDDPLLVAEHVGQYLFLEALRLECPDFWRGLKSVAQSDEEIVKWMTRNQVTDAWLVQVVWDTIAHWKQYPGSPDAMLEERYRWFRWRLLHESQVQLPLFNPIFSPASLLVENGQPETMDAFAKRIRREFENQLTTYVQYLRSVTFDKNSQLRTHAQWTALAFTGKSFVRISDQFRSMLRASPEKDKVVSIAVRRFAGKYGITMP